jgi:hypothetical protein
MVKLLSKLSILLAGAALLVASFIATCQRNWRKETSVLVSKLRVQSHQEDSLENIQDVPEDLPEVVRKYFEKVLPPKGSRKSIRSVYVEQEGEFLLGEKWIPFTATQYFSPSSARPAFVWDATMKMIGPLTVSVRDAYVDGKGIMEGKMLGAVTVVSVRDTPSLNEGELMRWLAESTLFPTALLPRKGEAGLKWAFDESSQSMNNPYQAAFIELVDQSNSNVTKVKVQMRFDEENLITSIHATRAMTVGNDAVYTPWEGHCGNYKRIDGFLIPTTMEVGWWRDGKLDLYFKGNNTKIEYDFYE